MDVRQIIEALGTKATAAATGAVSNAKYFMAYIKQVVTLAIAIKERTDLIPDDPADQSDIIAEIDENEAKIDTVIEDIASAVPEPPTAKSLQDILHKDTNYGFIKSTDALQGISDDIDQQHLNIHILFIIPEAVGGIIPDNTALLTELLKVGDVHTITQGDALEFPAFGSYAIAVLGSSNGTAWTESNLADLKNILGLTLICVDKVCAAYFEIGTDGGDATTKTVIRAISEIEGTKMGEGDANHQSVTGIDAGNNTVTSEATYHTLDMSNANITETVFCTEANDPDGATAKEDVVLGIIRRIQNDGSIGVDEAGADIPATLGFAGFAYEGNKLTTLGKALFLLFCHMLIQLRIQEQSVETGGLVADLRKRIFGNMKGSFTNTAPLVEYIAGQDSVGTKLPAGTSLVDLLNTIDGIVDTLLTRITAAVATASALGTHDTDIKALLSTVQTDLDNPSQYKATGFATSGALTTHDNALTAAKAVIDAIKTIVDTPANFMADLSTLETRLSAARAGYLDELDFALQEAIAAIPTTAMRGTESAALAVDLEDAMQKATGPAYNQDTDSLEALRELLDTMVTSIAALQTDLDNPSQYMADLTTLETRLSAARAGYLDQLDFNLQETIAALNTILSDGTYGLDALQTLLAAITAAGPTLTQMNTAHGLLATEAKQDIISTNVDDIETLVAEKVKGREQSVATTIDLNQAAATYDLFTGTDQAVVLESLNIKMPTGAVGGSLTSISIQTDDVTPGVIIDSTLGAVANLTSEANLGWTGTLYITVGTKVRLTIAGGAHGSAYVCNVTVKCRAVVSGGYLA